MSETTKKIDNRCNLHTGKQIRKNGECSRLGFCIDTNRIECYNERIRVQKTFARLNQNPKRRNVDLVKKNQEAKDSADANANQPKVADLPAQGKINKYGFIGVKKGILAAAGLSKGNEYPVTFTLEDGILVVRVNK